METTGVRNLLHVGCAAVGLTCQTAIAYELVTHARLTLAAFEQSQMQKDVSLLPNLGIPSPTYSLLGTKYIDRHPRDAAAYERTTSDFDWDRGKMPDAGASGSDTTIRYSVSGWLMRGAVREDDTGLVAGLALDQPPPYDDLDPYYNINRFCNHFFDPLNNRKLTSFCGGDTFSSAPVWASGTVNPFINPILPPSSIQEDLDRHNDFTIQDARESMWRALTGYDKAMTSVVAKTGLERKKYWATTFRALGDVVHLIEDMAQPQHTRDESHGTTHAAAYEKYIDARVIAKQTFTYSDFPTAKTVVIATLPPLSLGGYATIPRFSHYSRYWSTSPGTTGTLSGNGLADYSSRGFFTPGKNFGNVEYPRPTSALFGYTPQALPDTGGYKQEYLLGIVDDTLMNKPDTIRMTKVSMFSDAWRMRNQPGSQRGPQYTLDLPTFDDRAALLLPRASAYAAGLLDYFFNPRLAISLPADGVYGIVDHSRAAGFGKIRLTVTNVTPPLTEGASSYPQHLLGGNLVAVVKFHRNTCYKANLTGEYASPENNSGVVGCRASKDKLSYDVDDSYEDVVVSAPVPQFALDAGANSTLTFDFSAHPVPLGSSDLYLQVVYRGSVGPDAVNAEQDVVAVGTRDISEPTYFAFFNSSDYVEIGQAVYPRSVVASTQKLLSQVKPTGCVSGTYPKLALRSTCLNAQNIAVNVSFASAGASQVTVSALPKRRFFRIAYLTDAAPPPIVMAGLATSGDIGSSATSRLSVSYPDMRREPQSQVQARLSSVCVSPPKFDILPTWNQFSWGVRDPDPAKPEPPPMYWDNVMAYLRGIEGTFQGYCVLSGDGIIVPTSTLSGSMTALNANAGETVPFPVTILGVFGP